MSPEFKTSAGKVNGDEKSHRNPGEEVRCPLSATAPPATIPATGLGKEH